MIRNSIAGIAVAAAVLAACGDDDDKTRTSASGADRYCALTAQLDAAGDKFFSELERRDASPQEFEAAERRFVEAHTQELDRLRRAAPASIRSDLDKLVAGMHQRAGLKPAARVSEREASAAEERIRAFERRECR